MGCCCCCDVDDIDSDLSQPVNRSASRSCDQAPPVVNPTIQGNPRVVLLPKPYQANPHRIRIDLGVDRAFDGTAQLAFTNAGKVDVYRAAVGGVAENKPLDITNGEINAGLSVYIEGVQVSDNMNDIRLTLSLVGGTNPGPARYVDITCGDLKLEIFTPRPQGGDPVAIAEAQKNDPGGYVHFQRKQYCQRVKLIVHKAKPYDYAGNIVLSKSNNKVKVFDQEDQTGGVEQNLDLTIDNGAIHQANGQEYWVEGANASGALHDTNFQLKVEGLNQDGDQVQFTVVKAELQICKSRDAVGAVPNALNDQEKLNPGRFVHLQDNVGHHGRARLFVPQIEPNAFRGHLIFTVWDVTANNDQNPKVGLFQNEAGGVARANPYDYDFTGAAFPLAGLEQWAEGTTVSGALRDIEIRLGVQDSNGDNITLLCDKVALTVVRFHNLEITIPATPENRTHYGNNPVANHQYQIAAGAINENDFDQDEVNNPPVVLVEGSIFNANRALFSVQVDPAGVPVSWDAIRDVRPGNGDHGNVIAESPNPQPTLFAGADALHKELEADAVGTFHVCPYIDCNGSGGFIFDDAGGNRIDREPFIMMNLVLIRVRGFANNSVAQPANGAITHLPLGAPTGLTIETGDFLAGATAGVHQVATVDVIGGGQNGTRGLDKLFAGWVNNDLRSDDVFAEYEDPANLGVVHTMQAIWAPPPVANQLIYPPTVAPADIGGPLLDTSPIAGQGTGGNTCVGTEGGVGPPVPIAKVASPAGTGERWTVEMWDSPHDECDYEHPHYLGFNLRRYRYYLYFRTNLCFWTNMAGTADNADHPACRLYSSVQTNQWFVEYESTWLINPPYTETPVQALDVRLVQDANPNRLATPIEGSGFEVRSPTSLDCLAYDFTA